MGLGQAGGCGDVQEEAKLGYWIQGVREGKNLVDPRFWLKAPGLGRSRSWNLERGWRTWTKPVPSDLQVKLEMPLGR